MPTMQTPPPHPPSLLLVKSRRTRSGAGLVIELGRPRTLNALDLEAFVELRRLLDGAREDDTVRFVAIRAPAHENPKAFCAGGDVRRLHDEFRRTGTLEHGAEFFTQEYAVDRLVWEFPKPVLALTHGITMGGGIGLIRGASHRVACETSVWAMPEISIGLFPDVGATYFLSLLSETWAAFLALTGARLRITDVLRLGLATHSCRQQDLEAIAEKLEAISPEEAGSPKAASNALDRLLAPFAVAPGSPSWSTDWPEIEKLFGALPLERAEQPATARNLWREAAKMAAAPSCSPELREALETLLGGSPLSLRLILEQLRVGRACRKRGPLELAPVFEWEHEAALRCMAHGDFFEGVRSRLVDKDFREPGRPRWQHADPAAIDPAALNPLFPAAFSG